MKTKTLANIVLIINVLAICATITIQRHQIRQLRAETERLTNNQELLISNSNTLKAECRKYKVSDSLNAYKVTDLSLRLKEYERYKSENMALISRLKIDKSEMQKVIDSQASTIYSLKAELKDTIVVIDTVKEAVKAFDYKSKWIDIAGQINLLKNTVKLDIHNREELTVIESVEYRRFLGFLWKTKKVKNREVDVVSKNPNTEITDVEYVNIAD